MISADRSKRGILFSGTPAFKRQEAYAKRFGDLDIIGFSRREDGAQSIEVGSLRIHSTQSSSPLLYGLDALRIAKGLTRPDVVTAQDPFETGLVGWWIARKFKVPLHVQVHTDFLSPEYASSLLNRIRVFIAGFVLKRAARIRVVSGRIHDGLESLQHRAAITVLPMYTDLSRFTKGARDEELSERFQKFGTKLLVVARLEREKNAALAISSFARSASHETCLVVVGQGSQQQFLHELAKELGIDDRVFFENPDDIAPYYQLADLVLVPSKYEGYGLVIVEALATGKPVLSTDVGIAREAGAIITTEENFASALAEWFKSGPRTGQLKSYPYKDFDEYVRKYCDDIAACPVHTK